MTQFTLRPAVKNDFGAVRHLINSVQINPTGLDWRRFIVAVDPDGNLLACGQLKPHAGGIIELASIAVNPSSRNKGLARAIIDNLLTKARRPVYLTCRSGLEPFYAKWNFRALDVDEMPVYYQRLVRWARTFLVLTRRDETLSVMVLE